MAQQVAVREYGDHKDYEKDAQKMVNDGWTIHSVTEQTKVRGCLDSFTGRNTTALVVTYLRAKE